MKLFNSKNLFYRLSVVIASVILWFLIWQSAAMLLDNILVLPDIKSTFKALFALLSTFDFWTTVLTSIARIFIGFVLGVALGIVFAVVSELIYPIGIFISVGMTIVKSTPVASIIMVLWVILSDFDLPIIIALLMVMPIVYQNLMNGFNSIDKNLFEVAEVFDFSLSKKVRLLYAPALTKYIVPALLTSVGLAWKSGIAAEIITYTKKSIGKNIFDAKSIFESPTVFAWTLVVIAISLIFEFSVKKISGRYVKK